MIDQKIPTINPVSPTKKIKLPGFFKVEKKDQVKIALLLALLLTLVIGYIFTFPAKSDYETNLIDYENLTNEKESLLEKQDYLKELVNEKEARASFLSMVEDSLPQTSEVAELIVVLEKIAENNLLVLTNVTPREELGTIESGETRYSKIRVEFSVSGSYSNLKEFVKDLELNIRPIEISSITVVSSFSPVLQSEEVLRFNFSAYIYFESVKK